MDNRERRPRGSVFCPRGMEYLTNVETLLVEQKVQLLQGELDILVYINATVIVKELKIVDIDIVKCQKNICIYHWYVDFCKSLVPVDSYLIFLCSCFNASFFSNNILLLLQLSFIKSVAIFLLSNQLLKYCSNCCNWFVINIWYRNSTVQFGRL